ncbi:MAG TPA: hypothetical protein DCE41_37575 [Cytophagales bacterium]|nr:hypothetical protein [Cytophagales bacterium]
MKYFLPLAGLILLTQCTSNSAITVDTPQTPDTPATSAAPTAQAPSTTAPTTPVPPQPPTVVDTQVALDFINAHVANQNKLGKREELRVWTKASAYVTATFKASLVEMIDAAYEANPDVGLGYDPILDAQDYPEKGFTLRTFDPESGTVTLQGIDWEDFTVTLRLVLQDSETLVDGCGRINMK